jgi:hypothetical protein
MPALRNGKPVNLEFPFFPKISFWKCYNKTHPEGKSFRVLLLQGEIVIIILREIQCLGLCGDPLARIVFEFAAFRRLGYHTSFDAERLLIIQLCAVNAIFAGVGHFLSEQHSGYLFHRFLHYTPTASIILL